MEAFVGRKEQIKLINKFFTSDKEYAGLIYGRRRIGKTELIKHCLTLNKNIFSIYYECKETSEANNVATFQKLFLKSWAFLRFHFLHLSRP